jgi:hypothetical protein
VKERPILFSAPMVRALLTGTKTQTRRLVRSMPGNRGAPVGEEVKYWRRGEEDPLRWVGCDGFTIGHLYCPYGEPGDRLWVRETWFDDFDRAPGEANEMNVDTFDDGSVDGIEYRASHDCASFEAGCPCNPNGDGKRSAWRPSIFMPRWASRITLEVTNVRVERLQDIAEADAAAEGVDPDFGNAHTIAGRDYRRSFERLWDEINATRATWASNPWVWAVTFRRLQP